MRRLEGSVAGEAPLVLAVKSETMVFVPKEEGEVVDDEVSGAVVCERRLDAVLKTGVRLAVESDVEVSEDVVELRRLDEVTVCTDCRVQFGPGQRGPAEMAEAEQVAPRSRLAAKTR
jgi:hypothetical protein